MKKIFNILFLLGMYFLMVACGNNKSSAFGEVQTIQRTNTLGEVVTRIGYVNASRDSFTDDELVEFWHSTVDGSGFNFFTIKFGDGTGYVFPSAGNSFSHQQLDDDGAGIYGLGRMGLILEDSIHWLSE